jgi:hypothetical protein
MVTVSAAVDESRPGVLAGNTSAVSWPAVFAGAVAAAALSLILLVLGTGLGLASVSPWAPMGDTAKAISWATIGWIVFVAVASSALGGYIAGRLRTRWLSVHTDEVYFRDTAHGFLAWAVATLVTASVLTSAIGTILSVGAAGGAAVAAASDGNAGQDPGPSTGMNGSGQVNQQSAYTLDSLFRLSPTADTTTPATLVSSESVREAKGEIAGIFANSMDSGKLPADDATYAAQLVAQRTGMSQQDAETRVNEVHAAAYKKIQDAKAQAMELADEARKHAAYASLWIFISLLSGAFIASLMATFGGRQRDLY